MLPNRGGGNGVDDRSARIADREVDIWNPTHRIVRNPSDKVTLPRFGRADRLPDTPNLSAGDTGCPHPRLPVRPGLLREGFAEDREQLIPPADAIRPRRVDIG